MPPKPDLVLPDKDKHVFSESVTSVPVAASSKVTTSESKPKSVSEPLIEDWISDSENENETESKSGQTKPSNAKVEFVKSYEHVKSPRESVKKIKNNKQAKYPRKNSQSPRDKALQEQQYQLILPDQLILPTQDEQENVTTVRPKAVVSDNKGNEANAVKALACWVWKPKHKVLDHVSRYNGASMNFKRFDFGNPQLELQDKGVLDSGCSRHMTGNNSYLSDYEEIDGGFVAFGGNSKGGKITGKRKNSILFTDTECVILSSDFKLTDENHVLLKVPRKDNMYCVDLRNIVPQGGLTCLFAKATLDESNL
ncbi:hypothetical protein Tco_1469441 [Tanacetum coccineum]